MGVKVRFRRDRDGYVVQIRDKRLPGGRRQIACGPGPLGKRKAEAVAVAIAAQLASGGALVMPADPAPTVAQAAEAWLPRHATKRKLREGTIELRRRYLVNHVLPAWGARRIDSITMRDVEDLVMAKQALGGALRGKALSDLTIKTALLPVVRGLLDDAVSRGWLPTNPMRGRKPDWVLETYEPAPDPFEHAELRAILAAAAAISRQWALMLRVWAQAGVRSGELRGAIRDDLDATVGTVQVHRSLTRGRTGLPKTKRSRREVTITHPVCEPVAGWHPDHATDESRAVLTALLRVEPLDGSAPLFGSIAQPGRPMDETELHRLWRRTLTLATVRYRPAETLRHTFVSTLLSRGAPPLYVARQAGHSIGEMHKSYATWVDQGAAARPHATPTQPRASWGASNRLETRGKP